MTEAARRPRALSGIAATGTLHIGNYIGALSVWAKEQDTYDNHFMIADLHAHSSEFWRAVRRAMPDFARRRDRLRRAGATLWLPELTCPSTR